MNRKRSLKTNRALTKVQVGLGLSRLDSEKIDFITQ